ncbi:MAG TPA: hypothetical protein VJL87_04350, partial [Bdellovibrionota bacterium]|nr:hypothetical protein [Bdellovibrionota bacterium]
APHCEGSLDLLVFPQSRLPHWAAAVGATGQALPVLHKVVQNHRFSAVVEFRNCLLSKKKGDPSDDQKILQHPPSVPQIEKEARISYEGFISCDVQDIALRGDTIFPVFSSSYK